MSEKDENREQKVSKSAKAISNIAVQGFKSIVDTQEIEIAPLTILAGANSSGKSSIMQPLLLLKQTLEESYDPGALLLFGPNVKFTSADQFFSKTLTGHKSEFMVEIGLTEKGKITLWYSKMKKDPIEIAKMKLSNKTIDLSWAPEMTHDEIIKNTKFPDFEKLLEALRKVSDENQEVQLAIVRDRCFLELGLKGARGESQKRRRVLTVPAEMSVTENIRWQIARIIHLPGLRGTPERSYSLAAVGGTFPGTFNHYAASVISRWEADENRDKLKEVSSDLERLGLTWKVAAKRLNDTQVELQVGRLAHAVKGGAHDLVNIADVGFGVSQTFPVIAALHTARAGQLVYLEQPEIHLHPRAQFVMAEVLANAAKRGVRVVVETHSSLLLLGVQTLVAEGKLSPDVVKLHWFSRGDDGATKITSVDLDEKGRFGDWPEDFDDVTLKAQNRYLDAVEKPS